MIARKTVVTIYEIRGQLRQFFVKPSDFTKHIPTIIKCLT